MMNNCLCSLQTPLGTFKVKFDDCPAIFASHVVQDTALRNIISYEDALRNDISVGEKVLAPVGDDGKYKPGTVVEGVDIRKTKQLGNFECFSHFFSVSWEIWFCYFYKSSCIAM